MAFSFGGASSTPAFGAASSSGISFGGTATPAFGASSGSMFGTSSPSFSSVSTPAFGAATPSLFGTATPSSSGALFGAASSSSFSFGSTAPTMFGSSTSQTPGLFSGSFTAPKGGSSPSLFGGATAPLQPQLGTSSAAPPPMFLTKDNRLITHSTKWDDLSQQAQQSLMQLDKIVASCRKDCDQLDVEERLKSSDQTRTNLEEGVQVLYQNVATIGVRLTSDMNEAESLRIEVMRLLRHAEVAIHAFKRTQAWREAARVAPGQPIPPHIAEQLGGTVSLPSEFLSSTVEDLKEKLNAQLKIVTELQATLFKRQGDVNANASGDPRIMVASLESAITNLHDCLIRIASKLQALDERIASVRAEKTSTLSRAGNIRNPFVDAEIQQRTDRDSRWTFSYPVSQSDEEAPNGFQKTLHAFSSSPSGVASGLMRSDGVGTQAGGPLGARLAAPTGLFGSMPPSSSPSGTLFGNAPTTGLTSRRRGRR